MSKHMSTHPEFIQAFVATCYQHGFNEKQASELLNSYAQAEFYRTDSDFRKGIEETLTKEASSVPRAALDLAKAIFRSGAKRPGISAPILMGAAGGALAPEGMLPESFEGGAGSGAILGAVLGALATRGRGLGGSLGRIGRSISRGGVGRTLAGEATKLVTNPQVLKNTGRGILGGLSAAGTTQLMNRGLGGVGLSGRLPMIDPNTGVPAYMRDSAGAAGGGSSFEDPFLLPSEILAGGGAAAGASSTPGFGGLTSQIQNKRNEIVNLNNQIQQLESLLPLGSNPSLFAQRQQLQSQIDNMKMKRNSLTSEIMGLENQINTDKYNIADLAADRTIAATKGLQSAQSEFENLRRRQQMAGQGGFLGGLMDVYNRVSGAKGRLAELDPIYSGYQQQLDEANRLKQIAQ